MDVIFQYGLAGVVAYGMVGVITYILRGRFAIDLGSHEKLFLLIAIAFGVSFVPADLGNMLLNHIKDAVTIGFAIHSANTVLNKAVK